MFELDRIFFGWLFELCSDIGSVFGGGILIGVGVIILFFMYAYSLAKGGNR